VISPRPKLKRWTPKSLKTYASVLSRFPNVHKKSPKSNDLGLDVDLT